jgi:hypothetical protein
MPLEGGGGIITSLAGHVIDLCTGFNTNGFSGQRGLTTVSFDLDTGFGENTHVRKESLQEEQ